MSFRDQLKTARRSLGMTQAQAAATLQIGKRTLEHWEEGTRTPALVAQEGALARLKKLSAIVDKKEDKTPQVIDPQHRTK